MITKYRMLHLSSNIRFMLLCAVLAMVSACQTETGLHAVTEDVPQVSAVAVSKSGFALEPGQKVSWRSEILWVGDDSLPAYRRALTDLGIQQEIERQFAADGLQFVEQQFADYTLTGAVVIGDTAEGVALEELVRLHPSLQPLSQTLEKGTLLLALSHPGSPVILWRGAVQTFIAPDVPTVQRKQRLQAVVRSLINTIPKA